MDGRHKDRPRHGPAGPQRRRRAHPRHLRRHARRGLDARHRLPLPRHGSRDRRHRQQGAAGRDAAPRGLEGLLRGQHRCHNLRRTPKDEPAHTGNEGLPRAHTRHRRGRHLDKGHHHRTPRIHRARGGNKRIRRGTAVQGGIAASGDARQACGCRQQKNVATHQRAAASKPMLN